MTSTELIAARNLLGLTSDQFAAELGVTPHVYEAWERGTVALPEFHRRIVAYRAALAEREAALAASGIPECAWVSHFETRPEATSQKEQTARYEELGAHARSCTICQSRQHFVLERFGPMPELPSPAWLRLLQAVANAVARLPEWARPAAWGALLLGAMTLVRTLFMLPAILKNPSSAWMPLAGLGVAVAGGAFGGLVYAFVGKPLRRIHIVGPYLAGIVTVMGYLAALTLGFTLGGVRAAGVTGSSDVVIVVVLSTIFGVVLGRTLFRAPHDG